MERIDIKDMEPVSKAAANEVNSCIEEFNLSEKQLEVMTSGLKLYEEKDVKEFIRRREEVIQSFLKEEISCPEMWNKLNKLVGEKLK